MSDEPTEVTAPAMESRQQEGLPLLLWPIVFRFAAAAWFAVAAFREAGMAWLDLAFIAIPSLLIAVGLFAGNEVIAALVAVGDCTLAPCVLASRIGSQSPYAYGPPRPSWTQDLPMLLLCSIGVIEGGYLLRKWTRKWVSVAIYAVIAMLFMWYGWHAGIAPD